MVTSLSKVPPWIMNCLVQEVSSLEFWAKVCVSPHSVVSSLLSSALSKTEPCHPPRQSGFGLQNLGPGPCHHLVPAISCHCPLLGALCHVAATSPSLQSLSHHSPPVLTALWLALFLTSQVLALAWSPSHLGARSVRHPCPGHGLQCLLSTYGPGVP